MLASLIFGLIFGAVTETIDQGSLSPGNYKAFDDSLLLEICSPGQALKECADETYVPSASEEVFRLGLFLPNEKVFPAGTKVEVGVFHESKNAFLDSISAQVRFDPATKTVFVVYAPPSGLSGDDLYLVVQSGDEAGARAAIQYGLRGINIGNGLGPTAGGPKSGGGSGLNSGSEIGNSRDFVLPASRASAEKKTCASIHSSQDYYFSPLWLAFLFLSFFIVLTLMRRAEKTAD
jgi:hypothetical protein